MLTTYRCTYRGIPCMYVSVHTGWVLSCMSLHCLLAIGTYVVCHRINTMAAEEASYTTQHRQRSVIMFIVTLSCLIIFTSSSYSHWYVIHHKTNMMAAHQLYSTTKWRWRFAHIDSCCQQSRVQQRPNACNLKPLHCGITIPAFTQDMFIDQQ